MGRVSSRRGDVHCEFMRRRQVARRTLASDLFMNLAALAVVIAAMTQDTGSSVRGGAPVDSLPPSFAPTLANTSALAGVEDGGRLAPPLTDASAAAGVGSDSVPRRRKAIEYSDLYYTRLKIHQVASYLTVPLFVAQYLAGRELWNHPDSHGLARDAHGPLAAGIAGLFAVNTVTGVWNLWDSRKDPAGRTRRWIHGLTMLAADAGFVVVGATAPHHEFEGRGGAVPPPTSLGSGARTHRDVAIASMSLALGSYLMMLIWKD
jgi:hypothetical protein